MVFLHVTPQQYQSPPFIVFHELYHTTSEEQVTPLPNTSFLSLENLPRAERLLPLSSVSLSACRRLIIQVHQ